MLRNFQRRNCCKEITENRQIIVRQHRAVIISVVIGSVGQPSWTGAPLKIFKITLSRGVAFQLSISFTVVSSTCKISWRTKLQKPRNVQHFLCYDLTLKRKSLMSAKFKTCQINCLMKIMRAMKGTKANIFMVVEANPCSVMPMW